MGVLWRGGRALKKTTAAPKQSAKPSKVNGTDTAIVILDSDDETPASAAAQALPEAEFEGEEEELDPDQPYSSIIQQLRLPLHTAVLHISVPQIPAVSALRPADTVPGIFSKKMVFTVACADSTIRVITLPLNPPSNAAKEKPLSAKSYFGEDVVKIHGHQSVPRGVTMTWTARGEPTQREDVDDEMDVDGEGDASATPGRRRRKHRSRSRSQAQDVEGFDLLIASHSTELGGLLKIWRFELEETTLNVHHPIAPYHTLDLKKPASRIAFSTAQYPKQRHSQLLIVDSAGTARIFDPFASPSRKRRSSGGQAEYGMFVGTFKSTFENVKNIAYTPAVLAKRKAIIDAAWASDGHHILALLADGEWGVWDVDRSGPSPPADPSAFSLRGFVGTKDKEGGDKEPSSPKRSARSSLAPMTPNTRKRKEDALFHGTSSGSAVLPRGGVSVASLPPANGQAPEDAVLIWYGTEIYRIADLIKFWSRTASASNGSSLPGPGIQIQEVSLNGEAITSVSQFDTTTQANRMAVARDSLVSAEHRLIIIANTNQPLGRDLSAISSQEQFVEEETRRTDQALLTRGELDLGGMDRLLEDMEGSGTISKSLTLGAGPRKVLFAPSAA